MMKLKSQKRTFFSLSKSSSIKFYFYIAYVHLWKGLFEKGDSEIDKHPNGFESFMVYLRDPRFHFLFIKVSLYLFSILKLQYSNIIV